MSTWSNKIGILCFWQNHTALMSSQINSPLNSTPTWAHVHPTLQDITSGHLAASLKQGQKNVCSSYGPTETPCPSSLSSVFWLQQWVFREDALVCLLMSRLYCTVHVCAAHARAAGAPVISPAVFARLGHSFSERRLTLRPAFNPIRHCLISVAAGLR